MNTGDSAEEIVKISLDGVETAFRIAGTGAKNIAAIIMAKLNEEKQSKGKLRLTNMMKSGKPIDIFTINSENLKTFCEQAKKYGVRYCSLSRRKDSNIDGIVDLMVYEEDAPKIARIVERFKIGSNLEATLKQDLQKEKIQLQEKTEHEKFVDDIMPIEENEVLEEKEIPSNTENTEEKSQSETSLNGNPKINQVSNENEEKPSVIEELKEIQKEKEREMQEMEEISKEENVIDIPNEKDNKTQVKNGGKRFKENNKYSMKSGKRYENQKNKGAKRHTQNYNKSKQRGKRYKEPKHLKQRGNIR